VDDDPAFLALAARVLGDMGAEIVGMAEGSVTAMASANATRPESVLVDVGLEDGGGIALARQLAALPWAPRVVLTSSDADAARAVAAYDGRPGVPFIPKEDLASDSLRRLLFGD
jgi:two-component system nitrate/nitrite response regulator NarL